MKKCLPSRRELGMIFFSSLDPIHKEYRLQARKKERKNNNILPHFQRIIADDGHVLDISIVV